MSGSTMVESSLRTVCDRDNDTPAGTDLNGITTTTETDSPASSSKDNLDSDSDLEEMEDEEEKEGETNETDGVKDPVPVEVEEGTTAFEGKAQPDPEDKVDEEEVMDLKEGQVEVELEGSKDEAPVEPEKAVDDEAEAEAVSGLDDKEKEQTEKIRQKHLKEDAELEAYLESLKPKPKRKTIKEMLMSMPGFKEVAKLKPKIGGGFEKKDVIFLDEESMKKEQEREAKQRAKIEALKERFVRHVIPVSAPRSQKESVKLRIKKKEEDSQGLEHIVENEVEYVRNPMNEEEEANLAFSSSTPVINESPKACAPGAQRRRIQEALLAKIRAQKRKEHEERMKNLKIDNEEIDDEEEEADIEDDDDEYEDSELGEEEEELEDLLDGSERKSKKKKKKCKYVDEEAEDEDEDKDDDDDDDDDSEEEDEDDDGDTDIEDEDKDKAKVLQQNSENSQGSSRGCAESPLVVVPKVDAWSRPKESEKDALWSPLIHAFKNSRSQNGEADNDNQTDSEGDSNQMPASLAAVITDKPTGNLADLCSGRFVTQTEGAPPEDTDSEYAEFDFGDDDDVALAAAAEAAEANNGNADVVKTPSTNNAASRTAAADGITPKLSEKISKTRLLFNQFESEAKAEEKEKALAYEMGASQATNAEDDEGDDDDDEEEDVIGAIRKRVLSKKKRLQFSDDEDDGEDDPDSTKVANGDDEGSESEAIGDEEEEIEEEMMTPVEEVPQKANPFFNKFGKLKRKFVEDEAELSGSDEGSGDEDEKGLNHYEADEADEEEMDEEQLRHEVGQAHLLRLLNDDEKELKRLQEELLENGDLHTDNKRERKFKWSHINSAMDDDAMFGASDDDEDEEENPEELQKKREWLEKRKWMSENSHLLETDEDESQSLFTKSRFLKISKNTLKKIESFVDISLTSDSLTKEGPNKEVVVKETSNHRQSFLEEIIKAKTETRKSMNALTACSEGMSLGIGTGSDSSSNTAMSSMSEPLLGFKDFSFTKKPVTNMKKGSFLSRGGQMLSKLAESTKSNDAVSNVKINSRNFVFSHITPPNPEKTDGSTSRVKRVSYVKSGCAPQAKKTKIDRSFNVLDERSKGSIFKHFSN